MVTSCFYSEINLCPFEYPNVYHEGKNCCKYPTDCNGKPLQYSSTCCKNADYFLCPFDSGCDDCKFQKVYSSS